MALLVKHIQDHPGGGKSFRRQYPLYLRPYLSGTQLRASLGHPDSPDFLAKYDVALAERKHAGAYDALTPELIEYLNRIWLKDDLVLDEEARWTDRAIPRKRAAREKMLADIADDLQEALELRGLGDLGAIIARWGGPAEGHATFFGFVVDSGAPEFPSYVRALHDAQIEAWRSILKRWEGEEVPTPPEPEEPRKGASGVTKGRRGVPLLATFDAYATAQGISAGVCREWRRYIQHVVDFVGHDDARKLTREDVTRWRDHLIETPTRFGKPRKPVTVKDKYITSLRCTLGWAVEERRLDENVAADVKVRISKEAKTRDKDFTMEEAKAILKASIQPPSGKQSEPYVRARRWIPWLCAYSGARVNEISQLRKEDIQKVGDIWIMHITPAAGTVKTREARQVRLHAHLIEQGFLDMVSAQSEGAIFYAPSKQRVQAAGNRHFKKVGEKLAKWVREDVGITDSAIKPNHAWRHLFKTLSADAGIQERVADAIQGHAPSTVAGKYGKVSLKAKLDAMALFQRFELD